MATTFDPTIPRARYGLLMAGATVLAAGLCASVALGLGGGSTGAMSALVALLAGSFLTFIPAVARFGYESWGVAVLFSGVARSLVVMGLAYVLLENNPELVARPLFLGAVSGTVFVLAAETAFSVMTLSKIERQRVLAKAAGAGNRSTNS